MSQSHIESSRFTQLQRHDFASLGVTLSVPLDRTCFSAAVLTNTRPLREPLRGACSTQARRQSIPVEYQFNLSDATLFLVEECQEPVKASRAQKWNIYSVNSA